MNYIDELEREKAHSDLMKCAAAMWQERAEDAERTLALAVQAVGGRIKIHRETVVHAPQIELSIWSEPSDHSIMLQANIRNSERNEFGMVSKNPRKSLKTLERVKGIEPSS